MTSKIRKKKAGKRGKNEERRNREEKIEEEKIWTTPDQIFSSGFAYGFLSSLYIYDTYL